MLHSFKHAAPASVRRPSQDGYRPRNAEPRPSTDFRRAAHGRQSLDVRRPPRSASDLFPPRRRASEPLSHARGQSFHLTTPTRQGHPPLESPREEEEKPLEDSNAPIYTLPSTIEPTASPTAIEPPAEGDGSASPPAQLSINNSDINEYPPPLPYCLWDHKLSISFFWFLILAESCLVPVSLYYGLIYGTTLRHGARKSPSTPPPRPIFQKTPN
jgi:hypothetical protein